MLIVAFINVLLDSRHHTTTGAKKKKKKKNGQVAQCLPAHLRRNSKFGSRYPQPIFKKIWINWKFEWLVG